MCLNSNSITLFLICCDFFPPSNTFVALQTFCFDFSKWTTLIGHPQKKRMAKTKITIQGKGHNRPPSASIVVLTDSIETTGRMAILKFLMGRRKSHSHLWSKLVVDRNCWLESCNKNWKWTWLAFARKTHSKHLQYKYTTDYHTMFPTIYSS